MVNLLQIEPNILSISIVLGIALVIATKAALNMVERKKINIFVPFFTLGLGICLTAGFMFYNFFGVAIDIFYIFSFVSVIGIFFILWRTTK